MLSLHKKRRILITTLLVVSIALPSMIFAINKAINEVWADEGDPLPVVTYDSFGGVGGPTTSTCDSTNYNPEVLCIIVIPDETPTMEGYTFVGWWTSEGQLINHDSGHSVHGYRGPGESFYIDENTTLHAVYYQNYDYQIAFDNDGGSGGPGTLTDGDWHSQHTFTIPSATPTLAGHTFLGWTDVSNPDGRQFALYKSGNVYVLSGSTKEKVTLKAVWQDDSSTGMGYHFLNLNLNGYTSGGSIAPNAMGIYCDASVSGGCSHALYIYGMTTSLGTNGISDFAGWAETPTATTASITNGTVVDFDDRTIYAVSSDGETEPEAPTTCTIYYYSNASGTVSNMPTSPQTVDVYSGTTSCSFNLPTTLPTRDGYSFVGWSRTSNNSDGHIYSAGAHLTLDGNQTFYAQWQSTSGGNSGGDDEPTATTYTLSFKVNGGDGIIAPVSCSTTGTSCSVTIPSVTPTRSGYTFMGWGLSSGASSASYQPSGSVSLSSDQTLYAVWEENQSTSTTYIYTLTYDANGGSGVPSAQTRSNIIATSYSFEIPNVVPTRSGYTFAGWKKTGESSTYTGGSSVIATSSNPNITLVAQWTENGNTGSNTGDNGGTGNTGNTGDTGNTGNTGSNSGDSSNTGSGTSSNTGNNTGSNTGNNSGSNTSNNGSNTNTNGNTGNAGNTNNTTYTVMSGTASKHILSSGKTLTIKGSGDLAKFVSLKIDGTVVDEVYYTKASGSTILTISPAYLDKLPAGTHTATMAWTDGEVSTDFVVAASEEEVVVDEESDAVVPRTSAGAPNTGSSTEEDGGSSAAIMAIIPAITLAIMLGIYIRKFAKSRRSS